MKRREFIAGLGSAAAAWSVTARAQQPAKPVIGYLSATAQDYGPHFLPAFRQGQRRTDPWDRVEPLAHLIRPMPGHDASIECQYLGFDRQQLGPQSGDARARDFGEPRVVRIGSDLQQPLDAVASNWRHDPELGKERADRIDNRRLLADEQKVRAAMSRLGPPAYAKPQCFQSSMSLLPTGSRQHFASPW
jgi:hypothetical protein